MNHTNLISTKNIDYASLIAELTTIANNWNKEINSTYKLEQLLYQLNNILPHKVMIRIRNLTFYFPSLDNINTLNHIACWTVHAILYDQWYKVTKINNSEVEIKEILRLIEVREYNYKFEKELAKMIVGANKNFPYRTNIEINNLFKNCGLQYCNNNFSDTLINVEDTLKTIPSDKLYILLREELFDNSFFENYSSIEKLDKNKLMEKAKISFNQLITNSILQNKNTSLSYAFNTDTSNELLRDIKYINEEIEEYLEIAKKRYFENDKQGAVEKVWDIFEKLKNYFKIDNKKEGAEILLNKISFKHDKAHFESEFKILTDIANNTYKIRHHGETTNKGVPLHKLNEYQQKYYFFRMLSLIDYCMSLIKEEELKNDKLFN